MQILNEFVDQTGKILPRGHAADRPGQHVVEHERGDAEFRQRTAQGAFDGAIHAAAHEHAATFHVHRAHGVRKNHDSQDEPRGRFADVAFGFTTGVIGGGGEVV